MLKLLSLIIVSLTVVAIPVLAGADNSLRLSDLSWLEGSWKGGSDMGIFECAFTSPNGDIILGTAKQSSQSGKSLGFYEFDKIQMNAGVVELTPFPGGEKGVSFQAVESSDKMVVFEADHEWPHRITYSINENNQLVLRVQGTLTGQTIDSTFVMDKN
jgi:Domain of unknown function (DUF6265)